MTEEQTDPDSPVDQVLGQRYGKDINTLELLVVDQPEYASWLSFTAA